MAVDQQRWEALNAREVPEWFRQAKLGFFILWGPYSVPAWAEPTAELGTVESATEWYTHNPYSEWYYNTIRLEGSQAWQHQQDVYGGRPYDDFIDEWKAEKFDASALVGELAAAGADYPVLTTKHHDGVCLWDAPGTERNTVARGPKQDLVGAYADACPRARRQVRHLLFRRPGLARAAVPAHR
ncbi:alpha-L-fucosidase [Tessaracoccus massiliensis]|uniref:alpha-L-fucosidase n=1 Tax=Tessaracoccus massiliensis TaxID=1522311 RepID=UPI000A848BB4|nr:alpha-L-fucosidase [Tessaracoccus massiliensis]